MLKGGYYTSGLRGRWLAPGTARALFAKYFYSRKKNDVTYVPRTQGSSEVQAETVGAVKSDKASGGGQKQLPVRVTIRYETAWEQRRLHSLVRAACCRP